jgi:hypothetical protein
MRVAAVGGDGAEAEQLALSAVEHAAATISTDSSWRSKFANNVETAPLTMGRGSFTWKLIDEIDGLLSSGGLQPVRVWGIGRVGEARRCYSVQLSPGGTNLFTNPGTEQGITGYEVQNTDCTLESWSDEPRNGMKYLLVRIRGGASAGPQQNLKGKITSGASYFAEVWVKMTAADEEPWLCFVIKTAGMNDTVYTVRAQKAKSTEWTRVTGTLTPSWGGTPDFVYFRIETNNTNQDFKIDDLKIVEASGSTPMVPAAETWRQEPLP